MPARLEGKRTSRIQLAVEFIIEFIRASKIRLISVKGETPVYHVDERPWKRTI